MVSDWLQNGQIRDFFRSYFSSFWLGEPKRTEIWSEKVPDLGPIWPTLSPNNIMSLPATVCIDILAFLWLAAQRLKTQDKQAAGIETWHRETWHANETWHRETWHANETWHARSEWPSVELVLAVTVSHYTAVVQPQWRKFTTQSHWLWRCRDTYGAVQVILLTSTQV